MADEKNVTKSTEDLEQPTSTEVKPSTSSIVRPKTNEEIEKEDLELLKELRRLRSATRIHRFHIKAIGEAAANWDYAAARPPGPLLSDLEAILICLKASSGAGAYYIHTSYRKCGLWVAVIIHVGLAYATLLWNYILVNAAHLAYGRTRVPIMSYGDLAEASLDIGPFLSFRSYSRFFRYAIDIMVVITIFDTCFKYHVKAASYLKELFEGDQHPSADGVRPYVGGLILPIGAVCMITEFRQLVPFCLIANVFSFLTAFTTLYYGISNAKKSLKSYPLYNSLSGVFTFIPTSLYSLSCVFTVMPVDNIVARPNNMWKILSKALTMSIIINMTNGFFGYYGFGEQSKDPITLNYPNSGLTTNLKVVSVFILIMSYTVNFWTPFHCVWFYVKDNHKPENYWYMERVYRGVMVATISILVLAAPFNKVFDYVNSYLLACFTFIFPAFIELCMVWDDPGLGKYNWRFWKFVFLTAIGICVMFVTT